MNAPLAHICSVRVGCGSDRAMSFLSDPRKLSLWAVGMGETRVHPGGLVEGRFHGSGAPIWARIDVDAAHGAIYYHLGSGPESLLPRIMARVVASEVLNSGQACCVVSLVAWRQDDMNDERWASLCNGHESEISEIGRLLEISSC